MYNILQSKIWMGNTRTALLFLITHGFMCSYFTIFCRQSSKIDQLNAELSRKTATISQLQAEVGAIRSDYDHLLETVSRAAMLGTCSTRDW